MKPTNKHNEGCDPVSSNCVIWHGPDIECIDLCKGDSVTEVVHKLATELCNLLASLNVDVYDLTCLNLGECTPTDFKALIQLLIDKICEENNISQGDCEAGCPDCVVNICEEFYYTNPTGDTVTTMQLVDYVLAIGNRVCSLIGQISTINSTLQQHDARLTSLENAADPTLDLPQIVPVCVLPSVATDLDTVLAALEEEFCNLRTFTGNTTAIALALQSACLGLNNSSQLSGSGEMRDIEGWFSNPTSLAESFSNVWKTVCDLRNAVSFIQNNCCDTGCDAIDLQVQATLLATDELRLDFLGTIPSNFIDAAIGSTIVITDAGGGGPQTINTVSIKASYFDPTQPYIIPLLGVNGANDVIVKTTYRFLDPVTEQVCENLVQSLALGTDTCPDLVLTPGYNTIDFDFAWNGTTPTFVTVELLNSGGLVIASQVLNITGVNGNGQFVGLTEGTDYQIRLVINGVPCDPAETFTTLEYPCLAPTLNAPTIDYSDPEGDQNGSTIEGWIILYEAAYP